MLQKRVILIAWAIGAWAVAAPAADILKDGFTNPPPHVRPWTYWFFYNDHISKEGIDLDLAAMKKADIGTALLFTSVSHGGRTGDVKALSDEWWNLVKYAIRRAGEEGIDIGLFNCFGWSQSGGPWISKAQTMRHLVVQESQVQGPGPISQTLPEPEGFFQDVRVLAFPTPAQDSGSIRKESATITGNPGAQGVAVLFDRDPATSFPFPESALAQGGRYTIDIVTETPFKARSLRLYPVDQQFVVTCELQVKNRQGEFESIRTFDFQRPPSGDIMDLGPLHDGPAAVAFPLVKTDHFRLTFSNFRYHLHFGRRGSQPGFTEIEISGAYRLDHYVEKQLSKVYPLTLPEWDAYLWDRSAPSDDPALLVPHEGVRDISMHVTDGRLNWDVPAGHWTIMRICMVPTGAKNAPVLPAAEGPEVDKMSRVLAHHHFEAFAGKLLREMPAAHRRSMKYYVIDSYEKGSQNWSDDLEVAFEQTYGYDPIPFLPVFSGRAVGSVEQSERFMWDLRRLVADRVSFEYVGGLRDIANCHGMKLWLENYGHWGFPGEFLQYGGQADIVSGEFWTKGGLGTIELRAAASAAHTYGQPLVCAESFTSNAPHYLSHPWSFKLRGDWSFTEGVNQTLLTEYLHQPYVHKAPGVNAWFGTAFNRHNTWFPVMDTWIQYEKRCNFMLQQGWYVADLAYFIGEDAPKMTGIRDPEVPPGYAYDYINADVIRDRMTVSKGRFVLPDGMSYRLLVLPPLDNMRPCVLAKIRDLVRGGGHVYGPPPQFSPSLAGYPDADQRVRQLAREIWQDCDGKQITQAQLGYGRIYWGGSLAQILSDLNTPPDVILNTSSDIRWIHRRTEDAHIYFLSNQSEQPIQIDPVFRVQDKQPECWDAVTGQGYKRAVFESLAQGTRVSLALNPRESVFVVFRETLGKYNPLRKVLKNGRLHHLRAQRTKQGLQLQVEKNGQYTLVFADGREEAFEVRDIAEPLTLTGPWTVTFAADRGPSEPMRFDTLINWAESEDPNIQYYSGTAIYEKQITIPSAWFASDRQIILALGEVGNIATVFINGKSLGNFWHLPMEIYATKVLHPGVNVLKIDITSTWRNRLIGDAKYPDQATTWLSTDLRLTGKEALIPSGLMGPVQIKMIKQVHKKPEFVRQ